jgi:hypothetical protein
MDLKKLLTLHWSGHCKLVGCEFTGEEDLHVSWHIHSLLDMWTGSFLVLPSCFQLLLHAQVFGLSLNPFGRGTSLLAELNKSWSKTCSQKLNEKRIYRWVHNLICEAASLNFWLSTLLIFLVDEEVGNEVSWLVNLKPCNPENFQLDLDYGYNFND